MDAQPFVKRRMVVADHGEKEKSTKRSDIFLMKIGVELISL
ncbi:hypothetical protein PCAR4_850007 [Paraburkholderia caribensis]|nr:hypothetical protein PCAR4_850007 [Paraburkholderia caribensis]